MSKILSCWFWKSKSLLKKECQNVVSSDVKTESIIKKDRNYEHTVESQTISPVFLKRSNSFSDTICNKITELKTYRKKRKSYPVSPKKTRFDNKLSISDQNLYTMSKENFYNTYNPLIYAASTSQNALKFKPRATLGSNEPFPFEVPKDTAPRQSLFYELRYGDTGSSTNINANSKSVAEKPMEDHRYPSFSKRNQYSSSFAHKPVYSQNSKNFQKAHTEARPISLVKTPRESVKKVSVQPDGFVTNPNKNLVHRFSLKPQKNATVLMTGEGKLLRPVHADKVRKSSIKSNNETLPVRVSVVTPAKNLDYKESVPTVLARRSFRRSSIRRSFVENEQENKFKRLSLSPDGNISPLNIEGEEDLEMTAVNPRRRSQAMFSNRLSTENRENYFDGGVVDTIEEDLKTQKFPYVLNENEQAIYAVPVIPNRGRRSVIQQSLKSLTSKSNKDDPAIYRKNIRYSMDTDIFSAETRQRSLSPPSPGFVNMERGQPMLVSEVLNPITSLFISDLKNPVPKDPLRKPKEANNWVKPRRFSVQRSSVSKPAPLKPVTRVYQEAAQKTRTVPVQRRLSRKSYHKYRDESSSSDESVVVYSKKPKQSPSQRSYHHAVYAAQMPDTTLPKHVNHGNGRFSFDKELNGTGTSSSKDICGLSLGNESKNVKMVSSAQQTDLEDEIDLVCYPSESVLKKSVVSSESGSKLRWRIIIKRGEEK